MTRVPMARTGTSAAATLSQRVVEETQLQHEAAERNDFMGALLAGSLPEAAYLSYLVQLRAIYTELEGIISWATVDSPVHQFHDRALVRSARIQADIETFARRRPAAPQMPPVDPFAVLATTASYVSSIRRAGRERSGAALVGHHYIRYLGDLSGGFFLGKQIRSAYGVTAEVGAQTYEFPGIVAPGAWKQGYRANLDGQPWTAQEQDLFIGEVSAAFDAHSAILTDLGNRLTEGDAC